MLVYALLSLFVFLGLAYSESTKGIYDLVARRIPHHNDSFVFTLTGTEGHNETQLDEYIVSQRYGGKIEVQGSTVSAINYGFGFFFIMMTVANISDCTSICPKSCMSTYIGSLAAA